MLPGATHSVLVKSPIGCPKITVRGPRFGGVSEYTRPNGLTVLFVPDSSVAVTTVSATYLVGSRHEGQGETDVAHLLERMPVRGTLDIPTCDPVLTTDRSVVYWPAAFGLQANDHKPTSHGEDQNTL